MQGVAVEYFVHRLALSLECTHRTESRGNCAFVIISVEVSLAEREGNERVFECILSFAGHFLNDRVVGSRHLFKAKVEDAFFFCWRT